MAWNNDLKEINFKIQTCYYIDDIMNITGLDLNNILLDQKTCGDNLIYDVAYFTPYDAKPLRIIFEMQIDILKNTIKLNI